MNIKKILFILIILFLSCLHGFTRNLSEEEVIVGFGVTAYPFYGEPKPVIKCYWKNGEKICGKTYRQEDVKFYRKVLEKNKLLKPGERATLELVWGRIQKLETNERNKKIKEAEKAKNKEIQNIKNRFYEF